MFSNLSIVAHGGWGGGRGIEGERDPLRQIFKKLVNKNAIKPKLGHFFLESLDHPKQKSELTPSPGFSTHVHLCI
jgi:hypothetical protein